MVIIGVSVTGTAIFYLLPNDETNTEFGRSFQEEFGDLIDNVSYIGSVSYVGFTIFCLKLIFSIKAI